MAISAVSSAAASAAQALAARAPAETAPDRPNDGDRDDAGAVAPAAPTVNLSGQVIGQIVNTHA